MSVSAFQKTTIQMIAGTFKLSASSHARLFEIFYPNEAQKAKLDQGSYVLLCHMIAEQWADESLEYPKGYDTPERFQHFVKTLHCSVNGNTFCRVILSPYNKVNVNIVGMVGLIEPLRPIPKAIVLWNSNRNVWMCDLQQEGREAEVLDFEVFEDAFLRAISFANSVVPLNKVYWKANRRMVVEKLTAQYGNFDTEVTMSARIDSAISLFSELKERLFETIRRHEQSYFSTR